MKLRPYQLEARDAVLTALREKGSALLVMATGTGKTVTFAHIIAELLALSPWGRALVIAHREELIRQAARTIEAVCGEHPEIEMAGEWADRSMYRRARVIVASKDTLRKSRLARFDPKDFVLLVTDEAHHAPADSYTSVYAHFKGVPHLGATATPDRLDGVALGRVYGSAAFVYGMADAVRDGWLATVKQHAVPVKGLDFSSCRTTAGDLNSGDLATVMEYEENLHKVADPVFRHAKWRRALIFASSVSHAERLAEILNRHRPRCAEWLSGATPRDQRREILRRFASGETQHLVNVGVLTEGYDEPWIELVAIARPTKSRALYEQMIGRGTRPLAGTIDGLDSAEERCAAIARSRKPFLEVMDFVGNSGRHVLITAADILGGDYSAAVLSRAKKMTLEAGETGAPVDVADTLATAEREEEEARWRASRAGIVGRARFDLVRVDPFGGPGAAKPRRYRTPPEPASEPQRAYLERAGIPIAADITKREASALISEHKAKRDQGPRTAPQARVLDRFGYQSDVTFGQAKMIIDELARTGWRQKEGAPA